MSTTEEAYKSKHLGETIDAQIDRMLADYVFMGVATPTTVPDLSKGKCYYLASQAGEYTNFDFTIPYAAPIIFQWDGTRWYLLRIGDFTTPAEVEQIIEDKTLSELDPTSNKPVNSQGIAEAIEAALDKLNIEDIKRRLTELESNSN